MPTPTRYLRLPLALALAALALSACTVGPSYRAPDLNIDPAFAPAATQQADWFQSLRDPALDQLLQTAAQSNLNLQLATARIRESRAQRAAIAGEDMPQLNADAKYEHDRYSQNAAPFNAFNVPNFPWEFNSYQIGFDATWELNVFGGTRRAVEAANADVQSNEEDRHAVLVTLLAEIARNYTDLRGYQERRLIARDNLSTQSETLALTRDRMKNGVGTELDVARAQAQVSQTAAIIPLYDRAEWQALHRLAVLTNQPLDQLLYLRENAATTTAPATTSQPATESATLPALSDNIMVGVPADLLRRRPDIRRAERQLAAATARIGVAQAELYPRFSLTGYFNLQSASIEDIFNWRSRAFAFGPAISWPIFEGGRLRSLVRVKNAQADEALITYEQSVQNAIQEVRDQMIALSTEKQRAASLQQAAAANQESVDLAKQLYGQGLTDFLTVLDAQRQLYQAQDSLAESKTAQTTDLIALYKALGGEWNLPNNTPATAPSKENHP